MNTPSDNLPNEHSSASPSPDPSRPVLDGMPPAWQFVYDRLREGHAAAGRAFRQVYREASTEALGRQIDGTGAGL